MPAAGAAPTPASAPRAVPTPRPHLRLLPDTGVVVATAGDFRLLADVGSASAADAAAPALAILVWHDGRPLLVEAARSSDVPGPVHDRKGGRRCALLVDGAHPTRARGGLRAGRPRSRLLEAGFEAGTAVVTAEHHGFRRLPAHPVHRRSIRVRHDRIEIVDVVEACGRPRDSVGWDEPWQPRHADRHATARLVDVLFPLAEGFTVRDAAPAHRGGAGLTTATARFAPIAGGPILTLRAHAQRATGGSPAAAAWQVETTDHAPGRQRAGPDVTARFRVRARLPVRVRTVLTVGPPAPTH
jgi:hypothetical protein